MLLCIWVFFKRIKNWVCMCVCMWIYVCVWEREIERDLSMYVCVYMNICVCMGERDRKRFDIFTKKNHKNQQLK